MPDPNSQMPQMDQLLEELVLREASDLHLRVGEPPIYRIGGKLIRSELQSLERLAGRREVVLLCFEALRDRKQWCHRRYFAAWWYARTGEIVAEV